MYETDKCLEKTVQEPFFFFLLSKKIFSLTDNVCWWQFVEGKEVATLESL